MELQGTEFLVSRTFLLCELEFYNVARGPISRKRSHLDKKQDDDEEMLRRGGVGGGWGYEN